MFNRYDFSRSNLIRNLDRQKSDYFVNCITYSRFDSREKERERDFFFSKSFIFTCIIKKTRNNFLRD